MGMDVSGKNQDNEKGKYFRNNIWWWRPLADYCCQIAPEVTIRCQYWQSNDGDGLNDTDSKLLASALKQEVESGRCEAYAEIRKAEMNQLPDKKCTICAGTGNRAEPPNVGPGSMKCNGCNGTGRVRPNDTHYPFTVENVKEWIEFLENCGGFEIW